jgi:AraC-like DNA-binding protein
MRSLRVLRHYSDTVDQPGWLAGLRDPCVAAALAALHADLARPWTLSSLAGRRRAVSAAFAARFSQRVDEPAMRYLLSQRMQRARTLLRNQHATVAAVATQVGYQSDVACAAAFKTQGRHLTRRLPAGGDPMSPRPSTAATGRRALFCRTSRRTSDRETSRRTALIELSLIRDVPGRNSGSQQQRPSGYRGFSCRLADNKGRR